jgi:ATP-binding protein involved in chromosome partitioning
MFFKKRNENAGNQANMEEQLYKALRRVEDPDFKKDLVTLGMIKDLKVEGADIYFTIELTTPACPLKDKLKNDCIEAITNDIGNDYTINIDFTSQVTTQRDTNSENLAGIKNIIAVSSGKGGVGKSTVAINLAIGLAQTGASVGLLDSDIHGPSVPTMLNLNGSKPEVEQDGEKVTMYPIEKHGIKTLSIGFLVDPEQPIVWRGPMVSSALKQLFNDTKWGELDYLIVDLPPGTGDIHLTLAQQFPVTGALVVTTPQQVAVDDVTKTMEMYRQDQIDIPLIGVVENMSYFIPKEFPDYKYHLFGQGGGERVAQAYSVPLLGQIPLSVGMDEDVESGKPSVLDPNSPIQEPVEQMVQYMAQRVAIVNAQVVAEQAAAG